MKMLLSEEVIDTISFHASASYDALVEHLTPVFAMVPDDSLGGFTPEAVITMNAISHMIIAAANTAGDKGASRNEVMTAIGRAMRTIVDINSRGGASGPVFAAFNEGFGATETITVEDMMSDTPGTPN